MGLFGNIFGGGESAPNQENQSVNPGEGVDLLNNATAGEQVATENTTMPQQSPVEAQLAGSPESPVADTAPAEAIPAESSVATEAATIPDADAEDLASNVSQQLAKAGIELSGQVVVQQEVAPNSDADQAVATEDLSSINPIAPTAESEAPAPEQLAQADNDVPEAA